MNKKLKKEEYIISKHDITEEEIAFEPKNIIKTTLGGFFFAVTQYNNESKLKIIMEIKTVLETYSRYLDTFKDGNADIINNYEKIINFIDTNCKGDKLLDLNGVLTRHCIGRNIMEMKKRGINAKASRSDGWSTAVVTEGYRLLGIIRQADKMDDPNTFKLSLFNFFELANQQPPHLQLYLYMCYSDRIHDRLFDVSMAEMEDAALKASEAKATEETEPSSTE